MNASGTLAEEGRASTPQSPSPDQGGGRESHIRSLLKALSWRVLGTFTTATTAYVVTGEVKTALLIGGFEFVFKFFIYYLHERAWQAVPAGAVRRVVGAKTT